MAASPRYRFAPSPTGLFHVGGARTALHNWALAKQTRRHVRVAHRGHRRGPQPSGVDAGHHRCARPGSASPPTIRPFEGPLLPERLRRAHLAAAQRLFDEGAAYYCDLTADEIQARAKAARASGIRRVLARPRSRTRPRPGAALPRARTARPTVAIVVRGDVHVRATRPSRTSCCCAATARRCSCSPTSSTTSRWASPMSCAPRSTFRTRPSSRCCGRRSVQSRRCGPTCRCWSTSNARSCRSGATRWRSSSTATRAISPTAMVNYLMTLGWSPPGDDEIVPWSTIEADVPAGGRQPFAGVLRRQEARRVQRRVHPAAAARRVHRRVRAEELPADVGPRPVRARSPPHVQDAARHVGRGAAAMIDFLFLADARSIDEQSWDKTMCAPSGRRRCSTTSSPPTPTCRRGTPTL